MQNEHSPKKVDDYNCHITIFPLSLGDHLTLQKCADDKTFFSPDKNQEIS